MATNKQIQEYMKLKHGYSVKACWIAHMKKFAVLTLRDHQIDIHQTPGYTLALRESRKT